MIKKAIYIARKTNDIIKGYDFLVEKIPSGYELKDLEIVELPSMKAVVLISTIE
jgi:hypothetical protein